MGITVDLDPTDATDQNLTFAVPVDEVEHVVQQMVGGRESHPSVAGPVRLGRPLLQLAHQNGVIGGALAVGVTPNSPASRIGLNRTDIITSLNGQPVTSAGTLTALLSGCQPRDRARISFIRDGKTMNATIVVSNQPYGS